ncbi:MAG: hypothetical protein ACOCYP_09000 [Planctomycetota bacterium]
MTVGRLRIHRPFFPLLALLLSALAGPRLDQSATAAAPCPELHACAPHCLGEAASTAHSAPRRPAAPTAAAASAISGPSRSRSGPPLVWFSGAGGPRAP